VPELTLSEKHELRHPSWPRRTTYPLSLFLPTPGKWYEGKYYGAITSPLTLAARIADDKHDNRKYVTYRPQFEYTPAPQQRERHDCAYFDSAQFWLYSAPRAYSLSDGGLMTTHIWPVSHLRSSRSFGASILILAALLFYPNWRWRSSRRWGRSWSAPAR
jgi:hypothetical protein